MPERPSIGIANRRKNRIDLAIIILLVAGILLIGSDKLLTYFGL